MQLEAQPDPHFLARPAGAVLARGAVGRGLVAGIAAAAVAALEQDDPLADLGEVGEDMLLVVGQDLGADRHLDDQILAAGAGLVAAGAALAARRPEMLGVAKVDQRIEALDRLEDDVAALAAVAAVGPAIFDELLAPEADRARPARAGADVDLGLVEEMHGRPCRGRAKGERRTLARLSGPVVSVPSTASSWPAGDFAGLVARQAERLGHFGAEQRIAERGEHQPQGGLVHRPVLMALARAGRRGRESRRGSD